MEEIPFLKLVSKHHRQQSRDTVDLPDPATPMSTIARGLISLMTAVLALSRSAARLGFLGASRPSASSGPHLPDT